MKGLGDPWGYSSEPTLTRLHRRIFRLNDKIAKLDGEIEGAAAELQYHRSINDDAQEHAAYGNYIDREEAESTAADVRRFEKTIDKLESKRTKLVEKRDRLLASLGD